MTDATRLTTERTTLDELRARREAHEASLEGRSYDLPPEMRPHPKGPDLYVLRNPLTGMIKVGISTDVPSRTDVLSLACGVKLETLAVLRGGCRLERPLHELFAADRVFGEWFSVSNRLMELAALIGRTDSVHEVEAWRYRGGKLTARQMLQVVYEAYREDATR